MNAEHQIDKLFREQLYSRDLPFDKSAWAEAEMLLNNEAKKRNFLYRYRYYLSLLLLIITTAATWNLLSSSKDEISPSSALPTENTVAQNAITSSENENFSTGIEQPNFKSQASVFSLSGYEESSSESYKFEESETAASSPSSIKPTAASATSDSKTEVSNSQREQSTIEAVIKDARNEPVAGDDKEPISGNAFESNSTSGESTLSRLIMIVERASVAPVV